MHPSSIARFVRRGIINATGALIIAGELCAQGNPSNVVNEGRTRITLPDTSGYSASAREIVRLERRRSAAIASHDTAWLATLYSADFQSIVANGQRIDRAFLLNLFTRDDPTSHFTIDEFAVRQLTNDAAVMTGRLRVLRPDESVAADTRYTHVYIRRDGRWQIVAAQASAVASASRP